MALAVVIVETRVGRRFFQWADEISLETRRPTVDKVISRTELGKRNLSMESNKPRRFLWITGWILSEIIKAGSWFFSSPNVQYVAREDYIGSFVPGNAITSQNHRFLDGWNLANDVLRSKFVSFFDGIVVTRFPLGVMWRNGFLRDVFPSLVLWEDSLLVKFQRTQGKHEEYLPFHVSRELEDFSSKFRQKERVVMVAFC